MYFNETILIYLLITTSSSQLSFINGLKMDQHCDKTYSTRLNNKSHKIFKKSLKFYDKDLDMELLFLFHLETKMAYKKKR